MIKRRSEIQSKDRWNTEALFDLPKDWEKSFEKLDWSAFSSFCGRLHEGADVLKEALEILLETSREIEKLHTYAHMRHDEEITNDAFKTAYQKILARIAEFSQETAWFNPELLSLSKEQIESYLQDKRLAPYRFYLEKIVRMQPHTLSADKEELLALSGQSLQAVSNAFSSLNNADLKFGRIQNAKKEELELTHGLYQLYLRSQDRTLRENAFKRIHETFLGVENTLCDLISGQVHNHIFSAKSRKFPSSLEAALFPKNIPVQVYESLIATVRQHLPSLHRYIAMRKKRLRLDRLHLYDMYVPLISEIEIQMSYEEAEDLVVRSVAPLGEEYQQALARGLKDQRWVDRYENQHKRSGAYSTGCFDSYPYILMNFRGTLRDTFTLAHEAGHSMHSYLSHKNQPYQDSHYPIFVAEVASTFNEELLMNLLLKERVNKEERFFLLNEKVEDIRATFFRQTMFAEFELQIHKWVEEKTPLTPKLLKEYYHQLNADYFGKDAFIDEEISIEWGRIPHFYYNFYVYQYATGISAALALSEQVLAGDENSRKNYLSFLRSGGSLFPIDLLKLAGIDMTTPSPVEATIRKFDTLVSELETL